MHPPFDPALVREHVLRSIALARRSRFHFPACYLDLRLEQMDQASSRATMPRGLHNIDADGEVNIAALATLADITLGAAMRPHVEPQARMATVRLELRFTGLPIDGDVAAVARYDGQASGLQYPQGQCSGELRVGERTVAHANASFVNPPVPAGIKLATITTNEHLAVGLEETGALDESETFVLARAERALRAVNAASNKQRSSPRGFIEEFWEQRVRLSGANAASKTASNAVTPGFHTGNRVGHLQGGVLFGVAAATAKALAPAGSAMTGASAWFISPGIGPLKIKSCFLQEGKNISVVRTEVFAANRTRVLEMVSSHARKGAGRPHK